MEWTGYKSRKRNPFHIQTSEWCKNALEYLVHAHTPFLNDQEFLRDYLVYHRDNIDYMKHCGVITSCNEEGEATPLPFIPDALDMGGVSINVCAQLRQMALKLGIRLLSRVNILNF